MEKTTLGLSAIAAVGLAIALAMDLDAGPITSLANAHRAAGFEPSCEVLEDSGQTWALCSIGRTAPAVWLLRGEAWASGNGVAQIVIKRLEQRGPGAYQRLPRLYVDRDVPVYMPDTLRTKL